MLESIEQRAILIEGYRPTPERSESGELRQELEFLKAMLGNVVQSKSWRWLTPVRKALLAFRDENSRKGEVRLSVVITCRNQGKDVFPTLHSIRSILTPEDEIILVDAASSDSATLNVVEGYRPARIRLIRSGSPSILDARQAGLRAAKGKLVVAIGADQTIEGDFIREALRALEGDPETAFVIGGLVDGDGTGYMWLPDGLDPRGVAMATRYHFPVLRTDALAAIGGYDATLSSTEQADADLTIRLVTTGRKGKLLPRPACTSIT